MGTWAGVASLPLPGRLVSPCDSLNSVQRAGPSERAMAAATGSSGVAPAATSGSVPEGDCTTQPNLETLEQLVNECSPSSTQAAAQILVSGGGDGVRARAAATTCAPAAPPCCSGCFDMWRCCAAALAHPAARVLCQQAGGRGLGQLCPAQLAAHPVAGAGPRVAQQVRLRGGGDDCATAVRAAAACHGWWPSSSNSNPSRCPIGSSCIGGWQQRSSLHRAWCEQRRSRPAWVCGWRADGVSAAASTRVSGGGHGAGYR